VLEGGVRGPPQPAHSPYSLAVLFEHELLAPTANSPMADYGNGLGEAAVRVEVSGHEPLGRAAHGGVRGAPQSE